MSGGLSAPELTALRTFLAVYRWGAVGKAAEELHLSQPAVSHHLKALEQATGRPLFQRSGRGIAPTAAGHALAAEAGEHMDALDRIVNSLRPNAAADIGTVFLGAPGDVLAELVLPRAAPLLDLGVELRCRIGLPDELLAGLLADQLDIAVLTKIEGAPTKQLYLLHWHDEEFVLVGRPGAEPYDPAGGPRRFVGYAESMPMARRYFRTCWGISPRPPAVTVPDMRAVVRAVQSGAGLAVVPLYLAEAGIADGSLQVLHDPPKPVLNSLYLAMRRGREHVPRVRTVFTELIM